VTIDFVQTLSPNYFSFL